MSLDSLSSPTNQQQNSNSGIFPRRALTIAAPEDCHVQTVTVYLYTFDPDNVDHKIKVDFHKRATTEELIEKILDQRNGKSFFIREDILEIPCVLRTPRCILIYFSFKMCSICARKYIRIHLTGWKLNIS